MCTAEDEGPDPLGHPIHRCDPICFHCTFAADSDAADSSAARNANTTS